MHQFLVSKSNLSLAEIAPAPRVSLETGQIRLAIELFSFTANNITYASFGDLMGYWKFYPHLADASKGIIPVWGFAKVVESSCSEIPVGERFYGYYPPASEVVFAPTRISPRGFNVADGERGALAAVYNSYTNCASDPFHAYPDTVGSEAVQAVLRPLFITSWLIGDFMADHLFFDSSALLLSSASSKTAYGTAFCLALRPRNERPEIVGLTSSGNRAFCESLGCYDRVLTYDELDAIPEATSTVYVDFAGSVPLRKNIHTRFGNLRYSCSIGGTHVADLGSARDLPGPKATLFFAPAQIAKRSKEWGAAGLGAKLVASWKSFAQQVSNPASPWLEVEHIDASNAVAAYQQLLAGKTSARSAQVWSL